MDDEQLAMWAHDFLVLHPAWVGHLGQTGPWPGLSEGAKDRRRALVQFAKMVKEKLDREEDDVRAIHGQS